MNLKHLILLSAVLFSSYGSRFHAGAVNDRNDVCEQIDGDRRMDASVRDYAIGMNARPSYIIPTHGFYNGWNPSGKPLKAGGTADVQFVMSDRTRGVYQGIGVAIHTFGAHALLGTPATLYVFQGARLANLADNLSVGYEWNLGVSAGWHNNNAVTISPLNVYINVAALFTWRINPYWDMVFGPEYTHFSNGDTRFPNGGANTVNFRVGARRHFRQTSMPVAENIFSADLRKVHPADRLIYDLTLTGGFRADRTVSDGRLHIFNRAFPVMALNFNPIYRFTSYIGAGTSLDFIYDRSANLQVSKNQQGDVEFEYPSFPYQTSLGFSVRAELNMPVFAVNIGIGYGFHLGDHTRYKNPDLNGLYGMFALKAFLSDRLFLNVSYRLSSVLYSHNLMFGIGWRFGKLISHP